MRPATDHLQPLLDAGERLTALINDTPGGYTHPELVAMLQAAAESLEDMAAAYRLLAARIAAAAPVTARTAQVIRFPRRPFAF